MPRRRRRLSEKGTPAGRIVFLSLAAAVVTVAGAAGAAAAITTRENLSSHGKSNRSLRQSEFLPRLKCALL